MNDFSRGLYPPQVNPVMQGLQGPGDVNAIAGWWSDTNGLGQEKVGEFPRLNTPITGIAGVDALGPPAPFTVTLHADYVFGENSNCGFRALVEFGAGAVNKQVSCDFANGAQLAIAASGFCRVTAVPYAPNPSLAYAVNGSRYRIGASIGHSTGGHPAPYYTQRLPELAGEEATTSAIIIPPTWAESVQLQLFETGEEEADPYVPTVQLRFIDQAGTIFSVVPSDRFPQSFVPIPNGSRVQVRNGSGESRTPTLIWRLAL